MKIGQYSWGITNDITSYDNLGMSGLSWQKIGIQAPANTQLRINGVNITIGRTEIYEFDDERVPITSWRLISFPSSAIKKFLIIDYVEKEG